ncbi:205 kDa microtubule-associated protein isoform X1 [Drosophila takahashii]|uniref:205 kDa microtubule-associated protein isoform X1 n=2 Tax=Drosophila takahashii TaxID=29030 RepID=UPI001CF84903|nr:205 kDa microtubule-associated protein [Drosophila takahashii]
MEHHEDNAQLDNYLQNRLAESLQISGGDNEHHLHLADAAGDELSAPGIASSKSDKNDGEEDEEWKYIHEVQQSEKLQQQQPLPLAADTGNGFGPGGHSEDLVLGNGGAAGLSLAYEEEDVEVIKNDGDLSTNSNTTTSTDEVVAQDQQQAQEEEQLAEQHQEQKLQSQDLQQEDEDEPSSVATTYGTSSLSENNPTSLDKEEVVLAAQPAAEELLAGFDNKENCDYVEGVEENHSQLNPNAVAFVPSFGSQPSSPLPAVEEPLLGLNPRQLLSGGPLDDLVAESPRKGSARENMDAIAVPDEREFDIEADKRPHELELESALFGAGNLEVQLLNGAGNAEPVAVADVLDHGPETSVDMDFSLDQLPASADIMKQSIYAEHNASIEDILNSVQPLPIQTGDEKELLHVEEKEHVSQSPSTEELQIQQEFQHEQPLFNNAKQDLMQASFYLEHTSKEAQKEEHQELNELPVDSTDIFAEQSLLLDTSAPQFSPESDSPVAKLELESQQADIVDITPSPISSTEEKHLVEDTKELVEENKFVQESHHFEPFSVGAPPQMEEYAAFSAAPGSEAQIDDEISPATQGINPFAQPFTPAHLTLEQTEKEFTLDQTEALAANFNELQLQEELVEEQYMGVPDVASKYFDLSDKVASKSTEDVEEPKSDQPGLENFVSEEEENSPPEEKLQHGGEDFSPKEELASEEKIIVEDFVPIKEEPAVPEEQLLPAATQAPLTAAAEESLSVAQEEPIISEIQQAVLPNSEPLVQNIPETKKEEEVAAPLAEVALVAAAAVAAVTKSNSTTKTGATVASAKPKPAASTIKNTTTSSTSTAGANKSVAGRPRTAPVATKTTSTAAKPSTAAPHTAITRKPLSSNAASAAKPALKSTSTRPATAPVSKVALGAKTAASKPTASATALGTGSGSGTRTTARPLASTTARKPATSGTGSGSGSGVGSTARRPATNACGTGPGSSSAAATKPRLAATSTAPAKPKALSPRSTTSNTTTVRKVPSTSATSLSARSPTKPAVNGQLGKSTSSTTTTTTTTTITKTFTARPAPKFNHSASTTTSNTSTTRRLLVPSSSSGSTAASLRKTSPSKTSPVKAASKPLTPKPKESVTNKPSPAGIKARKSTPLKGATPIRAPAVAPPADTTSTTNGQNNEVEAIKQNGNGIHDLGDVQPTQEQPFQDQVVPPQNAEVSLLDF